MVVVVFVVVVKFTEKYDTIKMIAKHTIPLCTQMYCSKIHNRKLTKLRI